MAVAEHAADLRKMLNRTYDSGLMPREVPPIDVTQGSRSHLETYAPPAERDRLHKLADELDRAALDEIKYRFKRLTFDEMIELSEGISADPAKISSWAKSTA